MASSLHASLAQHCRTVQLALFAVALVFAQVAVADAQRLAGSRHADHWLFGTACRLSWNAAGDAFTFSSAGVMATLEGAAVWSHPGTGELVLYSDGVQVWNASDTSIFSGLPGSPSTMHGVVIVPVPGDADQLYVFAHGASFTNGFSYQKFDISSAPVATGALGTTSLGAGLGREGMLAVDHENGVDYWLLVSGASSIFVVPITSSGVGAPTSVDSGLSVWANGWHLFAASHQGDMIAMSGNSGGDIAIWDFDRTTGTLSNRRVINPTFTRYQYYGGVFSADRSKLYFATLDESNGSAGPSAFYQFDFDTGSISPLSTNATRYTHGDARLGPDGKIYVAGYASNGLHVIDNPDSAGAAAGFHFAQIAAPSGCTIPFGMPQFTIYADACPYDVNKKRPGVCGCSVADVDTDSDETPDCNDACPSDPNKTALGACGCGMVDTDIDSDETADCIDGCPNDGSKTSAGACGCGAADTDTDSDETADCIDGCPNDGNKTSAGACGCGISDADTDSDETADCIDGCPNDGNKTSAGACGCGMPDRDRDHDGVADCVDPCVDDADAGTSGGGCDDGTVAPDASASDAGHSEPRDAGGSQDSGPTEPDAAPVVDSSAGPDAGAAADQDAGRSSDAGSGSASVDGGCSCRAAGAPAHSRAAFAWVGLAIVWVLRRRWRRASSG